MSDVIVGIDLGTTNSLVAICEQGVPRVLESREGRLVPSVIHWEDDKTNPMVGVSARPSRILDAAHTAYSVKRYIGRGKKDLDPTLLTAVDTSLSTDTNVVLKLGKRSLSPVELSAEILKKLKKIAEESLGQNISKAVVTVPAYFNDSQRTATKMAGTLAGLEVVRIVNEPTAAALAYGLDRKQQGLIAVYDLGGGTFDISILKLHQGIFEVLSTGGDTALGGDDFDQALAQLILKKINKEGKKLQLQKWQADPFANLNSISSGSLEFRARLIELAEKIKINLSETEQTSDALQFDGENFEFNVTRTEFNEAVEPLIQKTLKIVAGALADAQMRPGDVNDIVMVGGSTRVPRVRELVRTYFGKEINTSMNPDEVVALGAAIQADILSGHTQDMVLLDIVPLSLGIETYGGTVGKIIHRNTKIPTVAFETYTTHVEGQRHVLIHVLQGERELAQDCRSLARFNLKGLPPMPAGLPKIEVTFLIDANGILTVRAVEKATKTEASIEVKPSYGLTDEQVEKMLGDSFEFAEQDIQARQLIDARVEAEGVLKAAAKILKEARDVGAKQTSGEIKKRCDDIETQMKAVRDCIGGQSHVAVKEALEKLEELAKPIAETVMNAALKNSLSHKHIDDVLKKH